MNIYKRTYNLMRMVNLQTRLYAKVQASMVQMPVRHVHARGYNEYYDNWSFKFHETNFALMNCKTTESFVAVFKKYGQYLTDVQMSYAFWMIGKQ